MSPTISLKAETNSRIGTADLLKAPGDAVLIQRGTPRWLLLRCPCGCGDEIPINLDPRAGEAWRLYRSSSSGLTLFPSVWRDTGCQSHFVIWRDRIFMFAKDRGSLRSLPGRITFLPLARRVLKALPTTGFLSYVEIADALDEIPWDVQQVCRRLAKLGALVEGKGAQSDRFRRAKK